MERTSRNDRNGHERRRNKRPAFKIKSNSVIESMQRGSITYDEIEVTLEPNLARELGMFMEDNEPENPALLALGFSLLNLCDELAGTTADKAECNEEQEKRPSRHR